MPLPGLSTLQSWLSNFRLQPGVCEQQTELLKKMMGPLTDMERQCTLMFDEMDISRLAAYDHARDQVFGPHGHLQVIMLSGLFTTWRLPVLFDFDRPVDQDLLFSTIASVEGAGARVAAVVCDQGPCNRGLWKQLGVTQESTCFSNPADSGRYVA